jgi:hypothetical protein
LPDLVVKDERVDETKHGVSGVKEGNDNDGIDAYEGAIKAHDLQNGGEYGQDNGEEWSRVDELGVSDGTLTRNKESADSLDDQIVPTS